MNYLFQDWTSNKRNPKARIVMLLFRVCHLATRHIVLFIVLLPVLVLYRLCIEWILGVEIPYKTKIGSNFIIYHGYATVINDGSTIGSGCIIRHCTTIGNKQLSDGSYSLCPVIGDYVDIGSNVCIIGPVHIGDNVRIGAGTIVTKSIPSNCVVVGNPARII